jgi:hypothetical protein
VAARRSAAAVAFDDIALQPPEIARAEQAPAGDVVSLDALWPMRRPGESGYDVIAMIEAYRRLPAGINACVELVHVSMDSQTKTPIVSRSRSTHYPDYMPVALRPIYCRVHLWWSIPRPATSPLAPVRG